MFATAVAFLHELRHVKFHKDHVNGQPRPANPADEELRCDAWARKLFTSEIEVYSKNYYVEFAKVDSKRSIALLIVGEFLRLANSHFSVLRSLAYPPLGDRISPLCEGITLPEFNNFWILSSCILFGEARRQGNKSVQLPQGSPKAISEFLGGLLASG